jgi:antitoxin (DNA-binding transcriptional repressor) of toxin-antitoxin stability system
MSTVTIEEAQAKLPEIIAKLAPGEAVVITRDREPVAQLVPLPKGVPPTRLRQLQREIDYPARR